MNEQNNIPQPPYYSVESIAQRRAEKKEEILRSKKSLFYSISKSHSIKSLTQVPYLALKYFYEPHFGQTNLRSL